MQTGFSFKGRNSTPVVKDFLIRWTEAKGSQSAFAANDSSKAVCSNGIIDFFDDTTENFILKTDDSFGGKFLDVIVNTDLCDDVLDNINFVTSKVYE